MRADDAHLAAADPVLARVIAACGSLPALRRQPGGLFAALCHSVVGQQLSLAAARTIWGRLVTAHGEPEASAWAGARFDDLRACGLSGAKARALVGIASAFCERRCPARRLAGLDDAAAREVLCELPGIGPWSAEMVLIFHLQRPDVFSPGDAGLRRAMTALYDLAAGEWKQRWPVLTASWRPHRSRACRWLWRSLANG